MPRAPYLGTLSLLALLVASGCPRVSAERSLVIGHASRLASLDLHFGGHNRQAFNVLVNVYEPLVERGPALDLRPLLAESWYSPDSLTWVFKLRPGVRRHDGRILTVEDVV